MVTQFFLRKSPDGLEVEIPSSMKVGRLETNELVLRDARYASRHHATLTIEGDALFVEDAGSANGTFVNGHRIGVKTRLQDRDKLTFDTEDYVVRGPPVQADSQKTVFRDSKVDKTEFRPPASSAQPPASAKAELKVAPVLSAAAPAQSPPKPPRGASSPAASEGAFRPGSWIDPQANSDPNATKFMSRDRNTPMSIQPGGERSSILVEVPALLIVSGKRAGQRVELLEGNRNEWTIGSDAELDVVLPDEGISHLHATIKREGSRWTVCNKASMNGIYVNGDRTSQRILAANDRIEFGPVTTQFLLPKASLLSRESSSAARSLPRLLTSSTAIAIAAFVATLGAVVLIRWVLR